MQLSQISQLRLLGRDDFFKTRHHKLSWPTVQLISDVQAAGFAIVWGDSVLADHQNQVSVYESWQAAGQDILQVGTGIIEFYVSMSK